MQSALAALSVLAASAFSAQTYFWRFPHMDAPKKDIKDAGTTDIQQLEKLCEANSECTGFNSDGWLKNDCQPNVVASATCDLYVKMDKPASDQHTQIMPVPVFMTNGSTPIALDKATFKFVAATPMPELDAAFQRFADIIFPHNTPADRKGLLEPAVATLPSLTVTVENTDVPLAMGVNETYVLSIPASGGGATLRANTVYGAYHGLQSFSQIVRFDYSGHQYLVDNAPIMINDGPKFPWRGLLIDTSRHWEPVLGLKQLIDSMAAAKLNTVHWHVVDLQSFPMEVRSYPKLQDGAYSQYERYSREDMQEVVAYAKARGVRVYIETDTPGHAAAWGVGYPQLWPSPTCQMPLNIANNFTFELIDGMIKEITSEVMLPSEEFYHLGGDEVNTDCWTKTPETAKWLQDHGLTADQGYEYFVKKAQESAVAAGKSPVQWEEVWKHFGTDLPKDSIIHAWLSAEAAQNATAHGYRALWSVDGRWYLDGLGVTWDTMWEQDPLAGITDPDQQKLLLGGEGCMWGETVDQSDRSATVWPRAAAIAERLWSYDVLGGNAIEALPRMLNFRCMLNRRGISAAPTLNAQARTSPPHPGSCFTQ